MNCLMSYMNAKYNFTMHIDIELTNGKAAVHDFTIVPTFGVKTLECIFRSLDRANWMYISVVPFVETLNGMLMKANGDASLNDSLFPFAVTVTFWM